MSVDVDSAMEDARAAAEQTVGQRFVESLAERFGGVANAQAVFGEPVERDGITVIPVAKVAWGVGGGAGKGGETKNESYEGGEGGGGGGGVSAKPLGYIEIRDGTAEFVRLRDVSSYIPVLIAGSISAWIFARALRLIFR